MIGHFADLNSCAGLAFSLRVGALTADAVALEARKAQEADDTDAGLPEPEPRRRVPTVILPDRSSAGSSAARHQAHLPSPTPTTSFLALHPRHDRCQQGRADAMNATG